MSERVLSTDLDGVIIERRHPFQLRALVLFLTRGSAIYQPPLQIPEVDRSVCDGPLNLLELALYLIHKGCRVRIGVQECLAEVRREKDIFVNTGRPNKRPWVDLTSRTLANGQVLAYFEGFFFKPPEVRALLSKAAAIAELRRRYQEVTHVDDNPADVLPLAKLFPDVNFVIFQDLTSGILFSRVGMGQYPNVRRVATLREGVTKFLGTSFR